MANPQFAVLSLTEAAAERARKLIETAGRLVAAAGRRQARGGLAPARKLHSGSRQGVQAADQIIEDQAQKLNLRRRT